MVSFPSQCQFWIISLVFIKIYNPLKVSMFANGQIFLWKTSSNMKEKCSNHIIGTCAKHEGLNVSTIFLSHVPDHI